MSKVIVSTRDIADLVGAAAYSGQNELRLDKAEFAPDFWDLRTGLLGELAQKLVNYGVTLTLSGDFSSDCTASQAFAGFLRESHRTGPIYLETKISSWG